MIPCNKVSTNCSYDFGVSFSSILIVFLAFFYILLSVVYNLE